MHSGITATMHQLTLGVALQVWALRLAPVGLHLASARRTACSQCMQQLRSRPEAEFVRHMRLKRQCALQRASTVTAAQAGSAPSAAMVSVDASGDRGTASATPTSSASGGASAATARPATGKGSRGPRWEPGTHAPQLCTALQMCACQEAAQGGPCLPRRGCAGSEGRVPAKAAQAQRKRPARAASRQPPGSHTRTNPPPPPQAAPVQEEHLPGRRVQRRPERAASVRAHIIRCAESRLAHCAAVRARCACAPHPPPDRPRPAAPHPVLQLQPAQPRVRPPQGGRQLHAPGELAAWVAAVWPAQGPFWPSRPRRQLLLASCRASCAPSGPLDRRTPLSQHWTISQHLTTGRPGSLPASFPGRAWRCGSASAAAWRTPCPTLTG